LHPLDQRPLVSYQLDKWSGQTKTFAHMYLRFVLHPYRECRVSLAGQLRRFAAVFATVLQPAGTVSARNH